MSRFLNGLVFLAALFVGGCVLSGDQLRGYYSQTAQVKVENGEIAVSGITGGLDKDVQFTDGYSPAANAFTSTENKAILTGSLKQPLTSSGSVALWFKATKPFRSTFQSGGLAQRFVTIGGLAGIGFHGKDGGDNCPAIYLNWNKEITGVHNIVSLLPEIPADTWLHIVFSWDSEKGLANAYISGTPLRPIDAVPPWRLAGYDKISIHAGELPVADIRIYDRFLTAADVRSVMGRNHIGAMDRYLGLTELGTLSQSAVDSLKGELFYSNPLAAAADIEGWKLEGPGKIEFKDGRMIMESLMAEQGTPVQGHIVNWCDKDMPENFVAEWDFQMLSDYGLAIMFFCAKGTDGQDIFDPQLDPRDGTFAAYIKGDIDNYHISYQANGPEGGTRRTSHIRKNSGFALAANGPVGVAAFSKKPHKIVLIKNGDHIQMAVDGRLIIDFTEDGSLGNTHGSGKMGLRQMKWTKAAYRNFKVYTIRQGS